MSVFETFFNGDGRERPLPSNRTQAFFYYAKRNFGKLVLFGVFCSLFFLPSLIWLYAMNYLKISAIASLDTAAENYGNMLYSATVSNALVAYLGLIPLTVIFFIGLAGMFSVVKRISLGQDCKIKNYFTGIKENWLRFALCGAVFGLSLFFLNFNLTYYAFVGSKLFSALMTGVAVVQFILVSVFSLWFATLTAVYENPLGKSLKNAVNLTFTGFFKNLLAVAAVGAPLVCVMLIPSPFQLLGIAVLSLFYIGFSALAVSCYANGVFDRLINPSLGEGCVGRGLRA